MKYKKALVTGGSGFIGSHVADALEQRGIKVVLFDSKVSSYKKESQHEFLGDICSYDDVNKAVKGCDIIFHFAAQADIGESTIDPFNTIKTNILGTQNVLEVAKSNKINRFIFSSTIYVYSDLGSFYRVSKQACEKIIEEYYKQFNIDYTILRFGSLYGPRANSFNAINDFLLQAINNNKIVRKSNGEELREYIHVKDAAKLSVEAIDDKYKNKHLIITGNQQIKVKDLLIMINEIFNNKIEIVFSEDKELHHYQITPYSYRPKIAEKISQNLYHDLGQGLVEQIYNIQKEINNGRDIEKITLR